jgi:hypothetical protein
MAEGLYIVTPSETIDDKGRTHVYTWQNKLPLHGGEKAIEVNWLQYQLKNAQGKITYTYTNSWVSDIESQQAMLS